MSIKKSKIEKSRKSIIKSGSTKKQKTKKQKKEYEFLEHTADVKFRAYGKSFSEATTNAVKATIQVMTDVKKIRRKQKKRIEISSKTRESMIYDFLEQIIFLIDTEGFLTGNVSRMKITKKENEYLLRAEIEGDKAKNYDVHTCIKAVTYNDMEIDETKNLCTIQVVLDI